MGFQTFWAARRSSYALFSLHSHSLWLTWLGTWLLLPPSPLLWAPDGPLTSALTCPKGLSQLARWGVDSRFSCPPRPCAALLCLCQCSPAQKLAHHLPIVGGRDPGDVLDSFLSWPLSFAHLLSHLVPKYLPLPCPISVLRLPDRQLQARLHQPLD